METHINVQQKKKPHVLILPYPIVGHINPMLQFAKRLLHKNLTTTLLVTNHLNKITKFSSSDSIAIETFSDGFDNGFIGDIDNAGDYLETFKQVGSRTLRDAVQRLADSGRPVDCLVYDPFIPWSLDVAKELGLVGAAFFTQPCAVDHIYHCVYKGLLKVPIEESEIFVPGLPKLKREDLPSFVSGIGSYPSLFKMVVNQFENIDKADWVFYNTFYKLEEEVIDYMAKSSPVKAIGPTVPSMYLDKRLPNDNEYGLNVFKPMSEACTDWLNQREAQSTLYVSFGSLAQLKEAQMHELAWGLKLSIKNFLWVVRSSEESKLPRDFAKEASEKGLIISWCPQLQVLAHEAICCFVTHCGWNSTLEALSLGVPMVAMPQWTDQTMNAKFVMDIWKMGIRADVDEGGIVRRETIASCINEVMEGENSEGVKRNAQKWKALARESMEEGGNSDKNIEEFVGSLYSQG